MQLSQRHVEIVNALYMMNLTLAKGDEGQRRQLTQKIDEQICFEFGHRWGMKARAGGDINSASKDSIGYLEDDGTVSVWDWQNGSSREPQIHTGDGPHYPHLSTSEAKFVEVQPVNHLSSVPDNGDDDDDVMVELFRQLLNEVKQVRADQTRLLEGQAAIMTAVQLVLDKPIDVHVPPIKFPEYKGTVLGFGVTLKPQV
jgi:hypothetical protein